MGEKSVRGQKAAKHVWGLATRQADRFAPPDPLHLALGALGGVCLMSDHSRRAGVAGVDSTRQGQGLRRPCRVGGLPRRWSVKMGGVGGASAMITRAEAGVRRQ